MKEKIKKFYTENKKKIMNGLYLVGGIALGTTGAFLCYRAGYNDGWAEIKTGYDMLIDHVTKNHPKLKVSELADENLVNQMFQEMTNNTDYYVKG